MSDDTIVTILTCIVLSPFAGLFVVVNVDFVKECILSHKRSDRKHDEKWQLDYEEAMKEL